MKGSEAQKQRPHKLLWMLWFDEKSVSSILTYYIENRYFLILITFRIFKVFSSEVLIILQDTLGQNEKFCNLPLTWPLQKKRLRKMQQGIILISQGGRIVFFDECSMYIYVEDFFWLSLFISTNWKIHEAKKEGEKKILHENSCSKCSQKSYFLRLLIYFQGRLFDQKSSISTFNRSITWHVCCCLFSSKKMYAS